MWDQRTTALMFAFLLGVSTFAVLESILSFQASHCTDQQQAGHNQAPNKEGAPGQQKHQDRSELREKHAVSEPFVCTLQGLPAALVVLMNKNEGFFVSSFTFMLVCV